MNMDIINRNCNELSNSMGDEHLVTDLIGFMKMVYVILLVSVLSATAGAIIHEVYDIGGPETALNIVLFMWWITYLHNRRQLYLCWCLVACSMFFGATVGPMINCFAEVEQRSIIFFFGGCALTVCFHLFAISCSDQTRVIFTINLFNLPLFMSSFIFAHAIISHGSFFNIDIPLNIKTVIPFVVSIPFIWYVGYLIIRTRTWDWGFGIPFHLQWLTVLAFSFDYNLFHILCIYTFVLFGFHHLKLHNFDCHELVNKGGRIDRPVTNVLTFYTDFVGRSTYLLIHLGQILVDYIWNKICRFCVEQWEFGLTFCGEALKAGYALFNQVSARILRSVLASVSVCGLSYLFFLYLSSKAQVDCMNQNG